MARANKIVKTNAMRALDAHGVPYVPFAYPDTIHSATEVAELLGVPPAHVFKSLVVLADNRHLLIMVPGDREIDPRQVARAVDAKSACMAPQREAERLTGLLVGGISPLALLGKPFEVYLDDNARSLDALYINGGRRGLNLRIAVPALIEVTGAQVIRTTA